MEAKNVTEILRQWMIFTINPRQVLKMWRNSQILVYFANITFYDEH